MMVFYVRGAEHLPTLCSFGRPRYWLRLWGASAFSGHSSLLISSDMDTGSASRELEGSWGRGIGPILPPSGEQMPLDWGIQTCPTVHGVRALPAVQSILAYLSRNSWRELTGRGVHILGNVLNSSFPT